MKKVFLPIAALLSLALLINSCSKSNNSSSSSSSNNSTNNTSSATFTAKVNGTLITFIGTATYNSAFPLITFKGTAGTKVLQIADLSLDQGTSHTLADYASFNSYATYTDGTTTWSTDATHTGTIMLSTYNASGKTATGTFSFTANEVSPSAGAGTISITSGSFANVTWN